MGRTASISWPRPVERTAASPLSARESVSINRVSQHKYSYRRLERTPEPDEHRISKLG